MQKPGPKPTEFDNEEICKFLDCLRHGYGIALAIAELKTSYRRYKLTLKRVRGFRREVRLASACSRQALIRLRYEAAEGGDARAQEFLIGRDDRARQFAREMKQRRAEFAARNPSPEEPGDADTPRRIIIPDADDRYPDRPAS
jgi:hypothetical protein